MATTKKQEKVVSTESTKEAWGIERTSTVKFVPGRVSLRENDQKNESIHTREINNWVPVLTEKNYWNKLESYNRWQHVHKGWEREN